MKKLIFTGAGVAIVTPFHPDGSVYYEKLAQLIEEQISCSTDAVIVCGTTGESPTLNTEEHTEVIRFAVAQVKGRIPVIAGTGSNDTAYAAMLSMEAEAAGADALLMVTPYYNKTSQEGLVRHFTHVADRVRTPIILYNVPSRTGVNILPETYARLARHPNIAATKEANGDISALAKTIQLCGEDLTVYTGNDDQITAFLALGGKGVISVLSNVAPEAAHAIAAAGLAGDFAESARLQLEWLDLCNDLFCDVNPIPVKAAMNLMGMEVGPCRLPLCEMSEGKLARLKGTLERHGLLCG
ncbi:MAG: 4-hydroxy-tetrahydrodipicolinate synthase [Oscillospiraceae bacterium]|jgi:4-hydroxy-tetrahydrodipicolinate synthase|nr:4-hydroxy-tetrahydrodipicolinate synthase [Oscillospiraceae bacterium]